MLEFLELLEMLFDLVQASVHLWKGRVWLFQRLLELLGPVRMVPVSLNVLVVLLGPGPAVLLVRALFGLCWLLGRHRLRPARC